MSGQELDPMDHIGLVAVALQRWTKLRPCNHWEDSEEWSAALEGLVHGCRTFRKSRGWKPSTWIVWTMRSKWRPLQVTRQRQRVKWDIACVRERDRQRAKWRQCTQDEDCEWILAQAKRLPWPESTIIRRLAQGESLRGIAIALKMHEKTIRRHCVSAIDQIRSGIISQGVCE